MLLQGAATPCGAGRRGASADTAMIELKTFVAVVIVVAILLASLRNPLVALSFFLALVYIRPGDDRPNLAEMHLPFLFVLILLVAYVGRTLAERRLLPESKLLPLFLSFFAWVALSALFGVDSSRSLADLNEFSLAVIAFLVMLRLLKTTSDVRWILWVIVGCGVVFVYYALFQGADCIQTQDGLACGRRNFAKLNINFGPPNYLGLNMVIMFSLAYGLLLDSRRRLISGLLVAIMGGFLWVALLTNSRGAFVAMGGVFIFHWMYSRHRLRGLLVLCLVLVIGYAVVPASVMERFGTLRSIEDDQSAMSRIEFWEIGFGLIRDHPLMGVGIGNFEKFSPNTPHNAFIQIASEMGLPALIIWVWMMLRGLGLLVLACKKREATEQRPARALAQGVAGGLLAILIQGMTTGLAHREFVYFTLALASALITLDGRHGKSEDAPLSPVEAVPVASASFPTGERRT